MLQVFIGFIPWILYWSFSGPGLWTIAILGGLIAAAALVTWRWFKRRDFKTMEIVTLGYFAVHAIVTLALGSSFLKIYGPIANSLVLAGMAFGTLAMKNPFTYQYAKEDWDKSYWNDPAFIRINEIITSVWGWIFTFNAALGALAVFVFPAQELWLVVILPNVGIIAGIIFSSRFPNYAVRKSIQARLDEWDPYKWPAPKFNGRPTNENEHDVIVIGSGIGGLSAAALLANADSRSPCSNNIICPVDIALHGNDASVHPIQRPIQKNAGLTFSTRACMMSADSANAAASVHY